MNIKQIMLDTVNKFGPPIVFVLFMLLLVVFLIKGPHSEPTITTRRFSVEGYYWKDISPGAHNCFKVIDKQTGKQYLVISRTGIIEVEPDSKEAQNAKTP